VVKYALEAAEELEKIGISAEVIDLRTIRPLDRETIVESVKKTSRCITVEEGFPFASIGSEIASILIDEAFDYLDAPIKKLASVDAPLPYAENLERLALPKAKDIIRVAKELCNKS
jgi:pyruvate dehydrogenase E1 component beta subunit